LLSPVFQVVWERWKSHRIEKQKPLGSIEEECQLMDLGRFGADEAESIVSYSIRRGALNLILTGDHKTNPVRVNGHGPKRMRIIGAED
jgi:hypothetical protein